MDHHTMHEHHPHDQHAEDDESAHDKHAGHYVSDFWKRFIVSFIVSIPVLALSRMLQQWFGFELKFPVH